MPAPIHDPLMERMRRADPTAGLAARADVDRARTRTARRRRAARRGAAVGGAAGFVALLATFAFALGPAGERGSSLIVEAGKAAELPPSSIVVFDSVLAYAAPDLAFRVHQTSVLRISPTGRVLAIRNVVRSATDPKAVEDESFSIVGGHPVMTVYDPHTGRVLRHEERGIPVDGFAIRVERLLASARARRTRARVAGHATVGGRGVYRIELTPPHAAGLQTRDELLIDAVTHKPIVLRDEVTGTLRGKPYFQHSTERVLSQRTLPDTPRNRRILDLHTPIPPG